MKRVVDTHRTLYRGAAFGAIHFDGEGHRQARMAALDALEAAQGHCLDRPIAPQDIEEAIGYLSQGCSKAAWHLSQFREGLTIPDQVQRFESTANALRAVRRCLGL
ncbi:MAG: hypothetical protein AAFR68_18440 [Pseudomonadota bacterium]